MSQLLTYTKNIKSIFKNQQINNFVLGNTSADYDSIFGSLIYAFYLTTFLKISYLPLIDCPKAQMKLRFQVTHIQNQLGINYQDLLYTEDVSDLYINKNNKFYLYDHNFRKQLANIGVVEIVDHHAYQESQLYAPYFINTIGSGLTMLYYVLNPLYLTKFEDKQLLTKFLKFRKNLNKPLQKYDPMIDKIIYYGILLDTFGFNPNMKQRWTQYDLFALQNIQTQQSPQHTYQDLQKMKASIQLGLKLQLQDHLKKDYKSINYSNIKAQYSVIYLPTDLFIKHYWTQLLKYFSKIPNTKQNAYFLMFAYKNQKQQLQRQLIFRSGSQDFVQIVNKIMIQMKGIKLDELQEWKRWMDPTAVLSRKLFDKKVRSSL